MSIFKVGDMVRCIDRGVSNNYGLEEGGIYEVIGVHETGRLELWGKEFLRYSPKRFELVEGHKHADMIMEYAKEAKVNPRPWEKFEFKSPYDSHWSELNTEMRFSTRLEYRRKPETVKITVWEATLTTQPLFSNLQGVIYTTTSKTEQDIKADLETAIHIAGHKLLSGPREVEYTVPYQNK